LPEALRQPELQTLVPAPTVPTAEQATADDSARPSERSVVSLRTSPPSAAVLQDGSELGLTPLDVSMSKGSSLTLMLKKKGFAEETLELRAEDGSRVVTLRRLREHERRERRANMGSRRSKDRPRSVGASLPNSEPSQAPSPDKSSPYERF
jgi:hypothetical protein